MSEDVRVSKAVTRVNADGVMEFQTPSRKAPQRIQLLPVRSRKTGEVVRYIVRKRK